MSVMRPWRLATVALVGLALVANVVVWCPCAEAAVRTDAEHGCCAPQAGWRAPSTDCCATKAPAQQVTTPEAPPLAAQSLAAALTPVFVATVHAVATPTHRPPAPPLILRI